MIAALFFYLFAGICVASAFMVIAARNPVHSVLYLILAFVNAAGLFVMMGAEFLAMILIVVYVGAVAVLFLFVVMMLDVDFAELKQGVLQYLPIGMLIGGIFLAELLVVVGAWAIGPGIPQAITAPIPTNVTNTEAIGLVLYTRYVYFFQAAGMILLVAMVGAIVLTLHHRPRVRRQDIAAQVARTPAASIEVVKVRSGRGWGAIHDHRPRALPLCCRDPVHARDLRHFPQSKNVIIILMSIELILLAVNINLVAFSTHLGDIVGQIYALLVLTVAAAEAAIGLAILVVFYRNRGSIAVEDINLMRG